MYIPCIIHILYTICNIDIFVPHEFEIVKSLIEWPPLYHSQATTPMGGSRIPVAHVLVIGHCLGLALLGFEVWENHQLRAELRSVTLELESHLGRGFQVLPEDHPAPTPEPSGIPLDWSKTPEIQQGVWVAGSWGSTDLGKLGLGLVFLLLVLLLVGLLLAKRDFAGDSTVVASSPSDKRDLAARQLAELRLRRHGFGQ